MIFVVKYTGPFGFIKPWTAVRDEQPYSQQFLIPSIVEGMEKKLFPNLLSRKGLQVYIVAALKRSRFLPLPGGPQQVSLPGAF